MEGKNLKESLTQSALSPYSLKISRNISFWELSSQMNACVIES